MGSMHFKHDTSSTLTLSIIQLDLSISQIDHPIVDTVTCVLDHLTCITPTTKSGTVNDDTLHCSNTELRAQVEKSILRYRREPDRWTSFTSLLLKSLAFYRSLDPALYPFPSKDGEHIEVASMQISEKLQLKQTKKLPIAHLPRTKYNRPYIPQFGRESYTINNSNNTNEKEVDDIDENCNSAMNISHQYPWVCMVQQQPNHSFKETYKSCKLGLDVVIFDARISEYTPTITEFLKSFVQSFTPWEWDRINNFHGHSSSLFLGRWRKKPRSDESKLKEFYLRWAMKEAYTKALGLGMNINFNDFETRLLGIDFDPITDAQQDDGGIWTSIMRPTDINTNNTPRRRIGQHQFSVIGKVKSITSPTSKWESWEFTFIPLCDDSNQNGCACICRGPLEKSSEVKTPTPFTVELLTLVDLIELHGTNPL